MLSKQQALKTFEGPVAGGTVSAREMTYGQERAIYPALAAESSNTVNPNRVVWVLTVHYNPPVTYNPCQENSCPQGAGNRTEKLSKWSEIVDAATGTMTDYGG